MKTIRLTIDFTYDDELMYGGIENQADKDWFRYDILEGKFLSLYESHDIGDTIGTVRVVGDIDLDD